MQITVYRPADRKNYVARWTDPVTGKVRYKSTGTSIRRKAEQFAARLEEELDKSPVNRGDIAWDVFRSRCEEEYLARYSSSHRSNSATVMDAVEQYIQPAKLGSITSAEIERLKLRLAERGCRPATVISYLKALRACFCWAKSVDLWSSIPKMRINSREGDEAKGRPLTVEEFERMLEAGKKLRGSSWPSWERLLWGLWHSGLRIGEALRLRWDREGGVGVDLGAKRPMFEIKAEASKNRKHQRFPMAPEFYRFLLETPESERRGFVFDPERKSNAGTGSGRITVQTATEAIAEMGREAGVVVKRMSGKTIYASAHDLRRTFGYRWAKRVMPPILQKLMRHESLKTTMVFYAVHREELTADAVWEADAAHSQVTESVTQAEKTANFPGKDESRSDLQGRTGFRSLSP